jgi:hypothetical protein
MMDGYSTLRPVSLRTVAKFLGCEPQILAMALRHLSNPPSYIEIQEGHAVSIGKALNDTEAEEYMANFVVDTEEDQMEVDVLERMLLRPDLRSKR